VKQIGHSLDQFANVVPDQSVAWTREQSFNRWIDRLDAPVRIDRKNAVPRRVEDRCAPPFTVGWLSSCANPATISPASEIRATCANSA
jgi:hypothetical protein